MIPLVLTVEQDLEISFLWLQTMLTQQIHAHVLTELTAIKHPSG